MARRLEVGERRGRRVLLWMAAVFALVQLVGGLLLDYRWPEIRFPSAAGVINRLESVRSTGPHVVCFGSSRFGGGFQGNIVRQVIREKTGDSITVENACVPSGDLISADYLIEQMLARGNHPRLAVVEICPETIARRNDWLSVHAARQLTWTDLPPYLFEAVRGGAVVRVASARLCPLHVHRREIWNQLWRASQDVARNVEKYVERCVLGNHEKNSDEKQVEAPLDFLPDSGANIPLAQRTLIGIHPIRRWLKNYQVGGTAVAALDRLLRRCQENHVQVLLVAPPLAAQHRELYGPEIEAAFQQEMARVVREHGCRFLDYRTCLADDQFKDNHHVEPRGGVAFTTRLTEDVLVGWWRKAR